MNIRHGDLSLIGIKELPKDLKPTKTKILMAGSGGHHPRATKEKH